MGSPQGSSLHQRRKAPGHADRRPPARLPRIRGNYSRGTIRRWDGDGLGHRDVRVDQGRLRQRIFALPSERNEIERRLATHAMAQRRQTRHMAACKSRSQHESSLQETRRLFGPVAAVDETNSRDGRFDVAEPSSGAEESLAPPTYLE